MFAFVFRRMMDVDHMLPVAVAMEQAGHPVRLGTMGYDIDLTQDPRLLLFDRRLHINKLRTPCSYARCALFLRGVNCLVMDWAKIGQHLTGTLINIARKRGIVSIALPHSVDIVAQPNYYEERINSGTFSHFHAIVVPNEIRKAALIKSGMEPSKISILGSVRFTRAWSDQLACVYPPKPDLSAGRLKVAYFDGMVPERYEPTISLLRRLSSLPYVNLAIQPKPLDNPPDPERTLKAKFPERIDMTHAAQLCRWADVVIGVSSSVMLEALVQGKHLIWSKYLDPNQLAFEDMKACWIGQDEEHIVGLLQRINDDRALPPPSPAEFMRTIIHGGRSADCVAKQYVEFLCALSGGYSSSQVSSNCVVGAINR